MTPKQIDAPTLKILLAEDDPSCTKIIKEILEKLNHVVICCADGNEALNALKNLPFDLAILDVKMPKLDGVEVVKSAQEMNKNLPIILMTGLSKDEIDKVLFQLNTPKLYYLTKPVLIIDLVEKIDAIFGLNKPTAIFK